MVAGPLLNWRRDDGRKLWSRLPAAVRAGAAVLFLAALLRLDWFTRNLPYRILGQQPLADAEEKDKEA